MATNSMLISEINCETRKWTSRITVVEDIPTITCGTGTKLKRYILADEEGNEITAVIFGSDIVILVPKLHLFKVYDITNAQVRFVEQKYRILYNTPYQWVLKRDTLIRPASEVSPTLSHFLSNLTPFSIIVANTTTNPNNIDVMGVILSFEEPTIANTVNGLKPIQRFTLIDQEKIPLCVTLWDELTKTQGPILMEAAKSLSVVVAKRLAISTYNRIALSAKNSSSFTINPPLEDADKLKLWIDSKSNSELQELLEDHSVEIAKNLAEAGAVEVVTLAELKTVTKYGDYWIRGFLQISSEDQKYFYLGCSSCNAKVSTHEVGIHYNCNKCCKQVKSEVKPYVLMSVTDETGSVNVLAIDDVAERILQTTASDIYRISNLGEKYNVDTIRSDFEGKTFLIMLRRNFGQQNEDHKKMLLKAYFDQTTIGEGSQSYIGSNSTETTSAKGKSIESSQSPLSPLKRQMSQITLNPGAPAKKKLLQLLEPEDDATSNSNA